MLVHQIPPKPDYLRVKIGRRLTRIGAVALKNTVYALPMSEGTREDFEWIAREVVTAGGDATLLEARLVAGLTDRDVESLFRSAREADYAALVADSRLVESQLQAAEIDDHLRRSVEPVLARLERRLEEVRALDFFDAPGAGLVQSLLRELRARLAPPALSATPASSSHRESYRRRTWVTRQGLEVDRIASAWLIRRFVDAEASFKFVAAKGYLPAVGELRFDMYDAEFTHEGDLCTFEVLCLRFGLVQSGLQEIAEIIHDIDVKDVKFERSEAAGVAAQISGLCLIQAEDEERLRGGQQLFDALLAYFARKREGRNAP